MAKKNPPGGPKKRKKGGLRMHRIPTPEWARPPDVNLDDEGGAEAERALRPLADALMARVQREVQRYIDDDGMTFETDEDGFPARSRMTGEYYIGHQYYSLREDDRGRAYYYVMIEARCLGELGDTGAGADDYLGLTVGLMIWRGTRKIQLSGVDSAVI